MNWIQFGLFFIYVFSMITAGLAVHAWLFNPKENPNKVLFLGEAFLLGAIILVAEMLICSFVHLYNVYALWSVTAANFLFLFYKPTRQAFAVLAFWRWRWDVPVAVFIILVGFFMFRNCYFLVDIDSHTTYLYTQKLWLQQGTSLFFDPHLDIRLFVPMFYVIPYALGLSIFPLETLFPQLVVAFWTVIVTLLVFGYVSWKFNRWYALAAVMMVLFNDHVFFSGANSCCIINSCLVAFIFMAAYNFWESAKNDDTKRFLLALIAITHFLPNKMHVVIFMFMMIALGFLIQKNLRTKVVEVFKNRRYLIALIACVFFASLWFIKNGIATGSLAFPAFSEHIAKGGVSAAQIHHATQGAHGPLSLLQVTKYFSYMFFWPGVKAFIYLGYLMMLFPLWGMWLVYKRSDLKNEINDTFFWLAMVVAFVFGVCLVSFVDPRTYRFAIAIASVAVVVSAHTICKALRFPSWLSIVLILLLGLQGALIPFYAGGDYKRPRMRDNLLVLQNKLHMAHMAWYYYPNNLIIDKEIVSQKSKVLRSAWFIGVGGNAAYSTFLLPVVRPQVGFIYSTVIKWNSYGNPRAVFKDLKAARIDYIMDIVDGHLNFEPVDQYAQRAAQFNRFPKERYYDYNFPKELTVITYKK